MTDTGVKDPRLTYSRVQAVTDCPRKHYYAYELGLRKIEEESAALIIGKIIHAALDNYYKGFEKKEALRLAMETVAVDPALSPEDKHEWLIRFEIIRRMYWGYMWWWKKEDATLTTIATEQKFDVSIMNPETGYKSMNFTQAGMIDKIVRLPDGRTAIMEHKTTSLDLASDSEYWADLKLDLQISLYWIAAQRCRYDPQTVIYDVIRKPRGKPLQLTQAQTRRLAFEGKYECKISDGTSVISYERTENQSGLVVEWEDENRTRLRRLVINDQPAEIIQGKKADAIRETPGMFGDRIFELMRETPEFFFARKEIPRTDKELMEVRFTLWQKAKELRERQKNGWWSQNGKACKMKYMTCPYFHLCRSDWDYEDFLEHGHPPEGFTVVEDIHQELLEADNG